MKRTSKAEQAADAIIEALPYFKHFAGKTVVIKYGGSAQVDAGLRRNVCEDLVLMEAVGIRTVLIHGGGPEISEMLGRLGKETKFVEGLRVTDEETAEVAEMVLVGKINKGLVAEINLAGGRAIGLSGRDGNLVWARRAKPVAVNGENVDLGQVGQPRKINPEILADLIEKHYIPVVAPTGMGPSGEMLNINGDAVAGHIAASLKAEKMIFLTDQVGVLAEVGNPETLISEIRVEEIEGMTRRGIISKGMIPKMESARHALEGGVKSVHIIDGRVPHALLLELFTSEGVGTMIRR
ncbi:MAG: acetylglutamate kinase [Candidatus Hydrogenedentota bacterium]|nr:MAG: acetylglutamate kinase [Candidatus Hydrogenedentota bacterium]